MRRRLLIAVLFGGCSEEHDVSVKSAMEVAAGIDIDRYDPVYVGITKGGEWITCERPHPGWQSGDVAHAVVSPDRSVHGLLVGDCDGGWRTVPVDVVFPV